MTDIGPNLAKLIHEVVTGVGILLATSLILLFVYRLAKDLS